jgi:hypothetical protein
MKTHCCGAVWASRPHGEQKLPGFDLQSTVGFTPRLLRFLS